MKYIIGITLIICFPKTFVFAQNYDSDSVYYSPIVKQPIAKDQSKESRHGYLIERKKFSYFFTMQSGALIGCKDCSFKREVSFGASTIQGVRIGNKLRLGAGLGFDTFQNWQTLPVFGSASWDLFGNKNRNALFIQFNYGTAKAWPNKSTVGYYQEVTGQRMVSTLIGFRIRYYDLRISMGVGSKYQRISASYQYPSYQYDIRGLPVEGSPNITTLRESINRLSLMMSIGWK
jgi:hypothetical protein